MADVPAPAVANGQVLPTTTITRPTRDTSEKVMSGPGAPAFQDFVEAANAKLGAQQGIGGEAPTAEDLDAQLAQDQAATTGSEADKAMASAKLRTLSDPFEQPTNSQRIDAELSQVPGSTVQDPGLPPESKPLSFAEAQDKVAQFNAENKAREQTHLQMAMLKEQQQLAQQIKAAQDDINARAAEHQKASDMKTTWEDMSAPQKILRILGNAMGAYASIVAGVPNPVQEMIKNEFNADMERKKAKMAATLERYKIAGAKPKELQELYENAQKNMLAMSKANVDQLDAVSQKILSRYPQAQKAAAVALANQRAEIDKDIAQFALANSGKSIENKGERVQTVTGKETGDGRNTPTSADEYTNAEMMARKAERGKELMKVTANIPTGKDLWEARNRQMQYVANLEAEKHGSARVFINDMLRGGPGFPDSIYPKEWSEGKKELVQLANENAHMVGVKRYGQTGMGGDHYIEFMGVMLGQPGESNKAISTKYNDLFDQSILNAQNYRSLTKFGRQEDKAEAKRTAQAQAASTPSKEERAGFTAAKMILENPKRFPPERVEKAKAAKANYERRFGAANE